ncbi:hypothetical protein GGX14DRAFT_387864 [Mycena pura]|uniref:Uncharacterized protein n=1 Tax=Mycena pura TaxID=153505 RepID=A0AAD7E293_9AGAR|nr:hypothetical protein GGX14DRAFT_387864 [Mycena pura]
MAAQGMLQTGAAIQHMFNGFGHAPTGGHFLAKPPPLSLLFNPPSHAQSSVPAGRKGHSNPAAQRLTRALCTLVSQPVQCPFSTAFSVPEAFKPDERHPCNALPGQAPGHYLLTTSGILRGVPGGSDALGRASSPQPGQARPDEAQARPGLTAGLSGLRARASPNSSPGPRLRPGLGYCKHGSCVLPYRWPFRVTFLPRIRSVTTCMLEKMCTQAPAQAWASGPAWASAGLGLGLDNLKPRPTQARPKPGHPGQARPGTSLPGGPGRGDKKHVTATGAVALMGTESHFDVQKVRLRTLGG